MDFTYLYDDTQPDFVSFMAGEPFTEEQVYADIDRPEHWSRRDSGVGLISRTTDQAAEVVALLEACLQLGEV